MVKTILPQSPVLQKYIEFFYKFDGDIPDKVSYCAFPHYNTGLSFFRNAKLIRNDFEVLIEKSKKPGIHIEILGKYTRPVFVHYADPVQEIAIIFKPLGINRFIRENYQKAAPAFSQAFQNNKWEITGRDLFQSKAEDRFKKLEAFLLSELQETPEITALEKTLPFLVNTEQHYTLPEVAGKNGYSLKSFQRHFTKHMGCSPVDFRRIVRFRNSVVSGLDSTALKSLTDITYENSYFDQSYFIKEFKRLTNLNPKKFFKEVSPLDGNKIVWEIR